MKNSLLNIENRRKRLLQIIKEKGTTNIHELAHEMDVSEMSIRRDCKALEQMGTVKISFGKIEYSDSNDGHDKNQQIELINSKIAKVASGYIENDQMIFINSSSTAIKLLDYLNEKRVNVLTNNLRAIEKVLSSESSLLLSGGELRNGAKILTGDIAQESFQNIRASVSAIGCGGLSINGGLTTNNIHEAQINRIIVQNCEKLIVLANYTKINKTANFTVGSLKDIDLLITDVYADQEYIKKIRHAGVEVIQAAV